MRTIEKTTAEEIFPSNNILHSLLSAVYYMFDSSTAEEIQNIGFHMNF